MNDDGDRLLFPRRTKPDDFKDHTKEIIWQMRNGYRRHFGIIELPPGINTPQTSNNRAPKK